MAAKKNPGGIFTCKKKNIRCYVLRISTYYRDLVVPMLVLFVEGEADGSVLFVAGRLLCIWLIQCEDVISLFS